MVSCLRLLLPEIVPAVRYGRIDCPFINRLGYRDSSEKGEGERNDSEELSKRKSECSRGRTICRDKSWIGVLLDPSSFSSLSVRIDFSDFIRFVFRISNEFRIRGEWANRSYLLFEIFLQIFICLFIFFISNSILFYVKYWDYVVHSETFIWSNFFIIAEYHHRFSKT